MKSLIGMLGITSYKTPERQLLQLRIARADRNGVQRVTSRKKLERERGISLQLIDSWIDPITEDETLTWEVIPDSPPKDKPI